MTASQLDRLHHLNVLVRDLDSAIREWTRFLGTDPVLEPLPSRGVRTARYALGTTWLVLVEPLDPESVPGRHLAAHGEGVFLLSFETADLDGARNALESRGIVGSVGTRQGLSDWTVLDLPPDPASGLQRQLCRDRARR